MFQCTMQWKNMFARIRVLVEVGKAQHAGFIPESGAGGRKDPYHPMARNTILMRTTY